MIFRNPPEVPFEVEISFHKLIENLEEIARSDVDYRAAYAKGLLRETDKVPELRTGIKNLNIIYEQKDLIRNLLADLFPTALTKNEIKAITIPFYNLSFNYTERLQQIINNAGDNFDLEIRDFTEDESYVICCCMILGYYYGQWIDFARPFFYDVPDENGILRHYRILINADFLEIFKKENTREITQEDIDELIDNFDNIAMWKEKFPPGSWILRGFGIMTLFDATIETAVSDLKTSLLAANAAKEENEAEAHRSYFADIFKSIFKINDLKLGYTAIDLRHNKMTVSPFEKHIKSFLLFGRDESDCGCLFCHMPLKDIMARKDYFVISDTEKFLAQNPESTLAKTLLKQDIRSAIFAPVIKDDNLLGVIEVVSTTKKQLNSINSNKLDIVMPYLVDTIDRYYAEIQNHIEALIQNEYTTIHPSVYWRFREEASQHLQDSANFSLHEIVFNEVYPLFGQIDIKGSSEKRNRTTRDDIFVQVKLLESVLAKIHDEDNLLIVEQKLFELSQFKAELEKEIKADTEQIVQNFIKSDLHPILKAYKPKNDETREAIAAYFERLDPALETIYESRKKYDGTVSIINKKMAAILDRRQFEAQAQYQHYFERFKTDGVEHNMYIGKSITNDDSFDVMYLYNLRLWQLQVMCEMESKYQQLKPSLPYPMDVASLILVINLPITIRFRMDEKRFDVDGSYNARYEVVKKRIDKAFIKGTGERITAKNKITVVYAQQAEETEYRRYIAFLQHKKMLGADVESFEIEDLQGVSGLKALRVSVMPAETQDKVYTYQELLEEVGS
jgi:hypothetical protein